MNRRSASKVRTSVHVPPRDLTRFRGQAFTPRSPAELLLFLKFFLQRRYTDTSVTFPGAHSTPHCNFSPLGDEKEVTHRAELQCAVHHVVGIGCLELPNPSQFPQEPVPFSDISALNVHHLPGVQLAKPRTSRPRNSLGKKRFRQEASRNRDLTIRIEAPAQAHKRALRATSEGNVTPPSCGVVVFCLSARCRN
jgi:hypothetical protein